MFKAIQTSISGLVASTVRANTAASNIVHSTVKSSPFKAGYTPQHVEQSTTANGGVRANVIPVSPTSLSVYDPTSPFANNGGNVDIPNISLPAEIGELTKASNAYKANAKVLKSLDDTFKTLLKI